MRLILIGTFGDVHTNNVLHAFYCVPILCTQCSYCLPVSQQGINSKNEGYVERFHGTEAVLRLNCNWRDYHIAIFIALQQNNDTQALASYARLNSFKQVLLLELAFNMIVPKLKTLNCNVHVVFDGETTHIKHKTHIRSCAYFLQNDYSLKRGGSISNEGKIKHLFET